jgi:hypothetical protein
MQQGFKLTLAAAERDRAKFLATAAEVPNTADPFTEAFLKGDLAAAAKGRGITVGGEGFADFVWEHDVVQTGLLYLAAVKTKDQAAADEHWTAFGKALARGDRTGRWFADVAAGKPPFDAARALAAPMNPATKRVVLAAFARKYPEHAKGLLDLSRKLDYDRDETSLCLRYALE